MPPDGGQPGAPVDRVGRRSTLKVVSTVLLDRDREVATLTRHLASIRAGAGRVVVVEGPAGIGKSSLLAAVTRAAAADGFVTCSARGGPLECDASWGVARQLFEPVRRRDDWADLTTGAAALAGPALALAAPEPAPGGDAMHAAVHGLVWLASNLAERQPVLLVVDDAHWADASSLRWLATLSRRLPDLPVGVLCAVRSGEPSPSADLLAELLAAAPDPTVRPTPLGLVAVEEIVAGSLPGAEQPFVEACHAASAGNPFLLGVLLAQVQAEGIAPTRASAARLDQVGADQAARSVVRQLARLPAGADRLAGALAVLGRDAPVRHAAALAGCSLPEAARLADALRAAGLVHGEHALTLAHPLIASSLSAHLGHGERARLHEQAAGLLADEGADPDRVAQHLLRTDPRADDAVVRTLRAAAAGAGARGAPESAAAYLRRALVEPPADRETVAAVHLELGLAQAARWQPDAPALLRRAVALADSSHQRVALALRGARALGIAGMFEEAVDLARRGLAGADTAPGPPDRAAPEPAASDPAVAGAAEARERLEQELVMDAAMQAATHAEAVRRLRAAPPDPLLPALTAVNAAMDATWIGLPATTVRRLLAPALVRDVFRTEMDSLLPTAAAVVLIGVDELDASVAWSTALIDVARPRGWLVALTQGCLRRSMALVRAGRIRDAEPDARLLFEVIQGNTPPAAFTWALHTLLDVLTETHRLDEAETVLLGTGFCGAPPPGAMGSPLLLQSRARLRLAQGLFDEAHADTEAARVRCEELTVQHPVLASWRVTQVEALVALGDRRRAEEVAREQLRLADVLGTPAARATGRRTLAQTVDGPDRVDLLEQATGLAASSPARLEHVRCLVDLGAALRRANRRADARIPLRTALDLADQHGMTLLAGRARAELHATGARPRRPATTGPGSLTPAEHRVVTLASQGVSNRDIAGQLYVTRRTVETHLTHAFQKLGVRSRAELPEALGGPHLAPPGPAGTAAR